jgi:AcrR family transcriptional regulator
LFAPRDIRPAARMRVPPTVPALHMTNRESNDNRQHGPAIVFSAASDGRASNHAAGQTKRQGASATLAARRRPLNERRALRNHVTEIQRSRLLAAAAAAVRDVGYARLTVTQIVKRARVSRKTFYDAFADPEDCFCAVLHNAVDHASTRVREAYARELSWRDAIRSSLAELLTLMDQEPGLSRLCVVDALGAGKQVLEYRDGVIEQLTGAVERGRAGRSNARIPCDLTADAIVGGVFAVLHSRFVQKDASQLIDLLGPIMSVIVLPYLGPEIAESELRAPRSVPRRPSRSRSPGLRERDPLAGLKLRLTRRTVSVLMMIATNPGASNRAVAQGSGIVDQGQISKLLTRLTCLGLVENRGAGQSRGLANAWHLTPRGAAVECSAHARVGVFRTDLT